MINTKSETLVNQKERVDILDEDHSSVMPLQKELMKNNFETRQYLDIRAGLNEIKLDPPDLVILDPHLMGNRNLEIIQELKSFEELKSVPLVVSSYSDDTLIKCLQLGGDDFILKPVKIQETVSRIKGLLRRRKVVLNQAEEKIIFIADLEIPLNHQQVKKNGTVLKLTPIEAKILKELAKDPGTVVFRQNLVALVWPEDRIVEEQNLDVHICSIRKKLEKNPSRPIIVVTVRGYGYKLNLSSF